MDREFAARIGDPARAGQEQFDPARPDRAAAGDMGGDPAVADHPAQTQIGTVVLGAGALDHFQRRDPGMGAQHGLELGRAALVGHIDQRGAGAVNHAKRAEPRNPLGDRGRGSGNKTFGRAFAHHFLGDLDRLFDHHIIRRCRRGQQGEEGQDKGGKLAHAILIGPHPLPCSQGQRLRLAFSTNS